MAAHLTSNQTDGVRFSNTAPISKWACWVLENSSSCKLPASKISLSRFESYLAHHMATERDDNSLVAKREIPRFESRSGLQFPMKTEIDLKGQKCHDCCLGIFEESSIQDDLHGTLRCTVCNRSVKRYFDTSILYENRNLELQRSCVPL